jgi:NAD(P)-dependent dehydrogenase (short-subunit alcohol dehydrogenase family)
VNLFENRASFSSDMSCLFDLSGKKALVTGASKGIGYTIAVELARQGADVLVTGRDEEGLNDVAARIRDLGREAQVIPADLLFYEEVVRLGAEALRVWPTIDILVNNAGIGLLAPAVDTKVEEWDIQLNTNVKAAFFLTQKIAPSMIAQRWGRIINISSQAGLVGIPNHAAYCASKGALELLTKVLALEWAAHGITVNCVAPTVVITPLVQRVFDTPEKKSTMLQRIPAKRFASCEEVAGAVVYLASAAAGMVNGDSIRVDGGWTAQ